MQERINDEDIHWVRRARAGDDQAFQCLMQKYQRSVYTQICVLVRNPLDAEELTNDVFIKAYACLGTLRQPCCFGAWLRQIARRHASNWWQRHFVPWLSLEGVAGEDAAVVAERLTTSEGIERRLLKEETYHQVLEAMGCLSVEDRALMEGFYVAEESYETLQERHGLTKGTLGRRLHQARQKVRERMEKLYGSIVAIPWWKIGKQTLRGGLEVVKLGVKGKVGIGGVAVLLALGGAVVWYASQPIVTEEDLQATLSQGTRETHAKSHQGALAQPVATPPSEAGEEMDRAVDEVVDEMLTWLDSLEKESPKQEEATQVDVLDEVPQPEGKKTTESSSPPEDPRLQELSDTAIREIPLLVAQWKEVMARKYALNGLPYSKEWAQEINALTNERTRIQHRIIHWAFTYHSIHPEEGAIYYPEGWIGRLAKQVGLVFGRTPVSP